MDLNYEVLKNLEEKLNEINSKVSYSLILNYQPNKSMINKYSKEDIFLHLTNYGDNITSDEEFENLDFYLVFNKNKNFEKEIKIPKLPLELSLRKIDIIREVFDEDSEGTPIFNLGCLIATIYPERMDLIKNESDDEYNILIDYFCE